MNLNFGTVVLADSTVFASCREGFEFRPVERFRIAEYGVLTEVYEPLCEVGGLSAEESERRDFYWKGLILLREGKPKEALEVLEKASSGGDDPVVGRCLDRARRELAQGDQALVDALAPALSDLGQPGNKNPS